MQAATRLLRAAAAGTAPPPPSGPAFVQALGTASGGTTSGLTLTVTAAVSPGNTVVLAARGSGGAHVTAVTDSKGNTYTVDSAITTANTCSVASGVITSALAAGDTITATFSGNITAVMVAAEYSTGLTLGEQTTSAGTSSTTVTCPSTGTLTVADGLLVAAVSMAVGATPAPSTGFTLRASLSSGSAAVGLADQVVAAGNYNSTWTWTPAANSGACLLGYT